MGISIYSLVLGPNGSKRPSLKSQVLISYMKEETHLHHIEHVRPAQNVSSPKS